MRKTLRQRLNDAKAKVKLGRSLMRRYLRRCDKDHEAWQWACHRTGCPDALGCDSGLTIRERRAKPQGARCACGGLDLGEAIELWLAGRPATGPARKRTTR